MFALGKWIPILSPSLAMVTRALREREAKVWKFCNSFKIYFSSLIANYRFNHIRVHLTYLEIANVTERVSEVRNDTCSNMYAWSEVGQIDAWK